MAVLKIAIVYNTKAGKGRASKVIQWLKQKLNSLEHHFEIFQDHWPSNFESYSDIWIVGGDGTLNYFINKYPDINKPLAIFRGGTGNDFAFKLYGDKDLEACLQTALTQPARKVDAGICNGNYFLNGVGIGFDGEIARSVHKVKFLLKGHLAYYANVIRKIFFFREEEVEVSTHDITWKEKAFMVTIANGSRYGGGFLVAPEAKIDDGLLDIILIPRITLLQRLDLLPGASTGKHLRVGKTTRSSAVTIQSNKKIAAHFDGEVLEADTFEINILSQKFLFRY